MKKTMATLLKLTQPLPRETLYMYPVDAKVEMIVVLIREPDSN